MKRPATGSIVVWHTVQLGLVSVGFSPKSALASTGRLPNLLISMSRKNQNAIRERCRLMLVSLVGKRLRNIGEVRIPAWGTPGIWTS